MIEPEAASPSASSLTVISTSGATLRFFWAKPLCEDEMVRSLAIEKRLGFLRMNSRWALPQISSDAIKWACSLGQFQDFVHASSSELWTPGSKGSSGL